MWRGIQRQGTSVWNWLPCCFLVFQDPYLDQLVLLNTGKKPWQSVLMSEDLDTPLCSFMHLSIRLTWLAPFSKLFFNQAWSLKVLPASWGILQGFRCNPSALGTFPRWHGSFFWEVFNAWSIYVCPLAAALWVKNCTAAEVSFGYCLCRNLKDPQPYVCIFWGGGRHKQLHTQAGTLFALWSTSLHYSGRAVAQFCKVICCTAAASGLADYLHTLGVLPSFVPHCSACHLSWFAEVAVCSVILESPWLSTLLSGSGAHGSRV